MTVRAALARTRGGPVEIVEVRLSDPGPGQVRVRLAGAGICHTDVSLVDGVLSPPMPVVLGHEGAGTVVAAGEGVTSIAEGDQVLLNWSASCGTCRACRRDETHLCQRGQEHAGRPYARLPDGTKVFAGLGVGALAEETVVSWDSVVRLPGGLPLAEAALLGCAVLTGFGAVRHAARVGRDESVVVVGLGGVGLSVVQAARIAGATPIIGVDLSAAKGELALRQGATHVVAAGPAMAARIRELTGGEGADHAFECAGRAETIRRAWASTRRGGRTTVLGIGPGTERVTFSAMEIFHYARTLSGCVFGNSRPERDLPALADDVVTGRLRLADLVGERIRLDDVPAALARVGERGRSLVMF